MGECKAEVSLFDAFMLMPQKGVECHTGGDTADVPCLMGLMLLPKKGRMAYKHVMTSAKSQDNLEAGIHAAAMW